MTFTCCHLRSPLRPGEALTAATAQLPTAGGQVTGVVLSDLRKEMRRRLQPDLPIGADAPDAYGWVNNVIEAVRTVGRSLIATLGHAFPVFLTPRHDLDLDDLSPLEEVEIHFRDGRAGNGWTISRPNGDPLFTFDLPRQLFELYADEGVLSRRAAADLKATFLGEFTAIYAPDDQIKFFNFRLAAGWLEGVRANLDRENLE